MKMRSLAVAGIAAAVAYGAFSVMSKDEDGFDAALWKAERGRYEERNQRQGMLDDAAAAAPLGASMEEARALYGEPELETDSVRVSAEGAERAQRLWYYYAGPNGLFASEQAVLILTFDDHGRLSDAAATTTETWPD